MLLDLILLTYRSVELLSCAVDLLKSPNSCSPSQTGLRWDNPRCSYDPRTHCPSDACMIFNLFRIVCLSFQASTRFSFVESLMCRPLLSIRKGITARGHYRTVIGLHSRLARRRLNILSGSKKLPCQGV